jgi:hypothetical protein
MIRRIDNTFSKPSASHRFERETPMHSTDFTCNQALDRAAGLQMRCKHRDSTALTCAVAHVSWRHNENGFHIV